MPDTVHLDQVSKTYPGGNQALDGVSLDVPPGCFFVLLGPSGSGKTTLLRCLAGIERISSGRIAIGDRLVADNRYHLPSERRELSMVFQDYALWPHLNARDNVAFALRRRRRPRPERQAEAVKTLELVGLGSLTLRYPNELSGGEQQRVALARALVAKTGLVLCDEPLSNLDADLRERMRVEIAMRVRDIGATTIYITHDQAEAFALADQLGVLEHGKLVQLGTPEQIYRDPATAFVARFTGLAVELPVRLLERNGSTTVSVEPTTGLRLARPLVARSFLADRDTLKALLAIRPAAVRLCAPDGNQHHLVGTVADVAFRDRGYEHAIQLSNRTRVTGVYAPQRAGRGEVVGLTFEADGCLVFPHVRSVTEAETREEA
ncbi:MAG TPA: ABC transporter ATP-binding protein [Gaiellaceae bacterium]|nr:ABC transporter ATP-binding protein [Gaiellaceae bacterium]